MSTWIFDPTTLPGFKRLHRTPMHKTLVDDIDSGKEARVQKWTTQRWRYEPEIEVLRASAALQELQAVVNFFGRHAGKRDSFLLDDPDDGTVTDHGFGVGDGATTIFQLQRTLGGNVKDVLGTWPTYTKPRTNACLYSQAFDNAAWTKTNSSITPNAAIASDGTLTAEKLVESAVNSTHTASQVINFTSGVTYCASVYVKAAERTKCELSLVGGAFATNPKIGSVDLTNGTTVGPQQGALTAGVQSVGNGWYRIWFTATAGSTASSTLTLYLVTTSGSYLGDGTSGLYAWGAQVETGATATRYIATTSAVVRQDPLYWQAMGDGFEPVTEPDWATVTILKDGVAQTPGTAFTYTAAGVVTFAAAPAIGSALSWTGNFYRRVRLDSDEPRFEQILPGYFRGPFEMISVV